MKPCPLIATALVLASASFAQEAVNVSRTGLPQLPLTFLENVGQ